MDIIFHSVMGLIFGGSALFIGWFIYSMIKIEIDHEKEKW